jgi:hypothetical protein
MHTGKRKSEIIQKKLEELEKNILEKDKLIANIVEIVKKKKP